MRHPPPLKLSKKQIQELENLTRKKTSNPKQKLRARIILLASHGMSRLSIEKELGVSQPTIRLWINKYKLNGVRSLAGNSTGAGRKRVDQKWILDATKKIHPTNGDCWTTRSLATVLGVSHVTVFNVWKEYGVKPEPVINSKMKDNYLTKLKKLHSKTKNKFWTVQELVEAGIKVGLQLDTVIEKGFLVPLNSEPTKGKILERVYWLSFSVHPLHTPTVIILEALKSGPMNFDQIRSELPSTAIKNKRQLRELLEFLELFGQIDRVLGPDGTIIYRRK